MRVRDAAGDEHAGREVAIGPPPAKHGQAGAEREDLPGPRPAARKFETALSTRLTGADGQGVNAYA